MSIGSKSNNIAYLEQIQLRIIKDKIQYNRLLTGDRISNEMYNHLKSVYKLSSGKNADAEIIIKYIDHANYTNITLSEKEAIIVFPSISTNKYSGLKISHTENVNNYIKYFYEVFSNESNTKIPNMNSLESIRTKNNLVVR